MRRIRKKYKKNKIVIITITILLILSLSVGYSVFNTNININTKGNLKDSVWNFDYIGSEQTFVVPYTGTYQLETWGAQGGNTSMPNSNDQIGGYGGYSIGNIILNKDEKLYLNVGENGKPCNEKSINHIECNTAAYCCIGTYNGGGDSSSANSSNDNAGTGGGATHISNTSGLLSTLENNKNNILIVSGGGGGSYAWKDKDYTADGGNAGGFIGGSGKLSQYYGSYLAGTGGTQELGGNKGGFRGSDGLFGQGGLGNQSRAAGGGGGFYGGGSSAHNGAGGGSGYIGNTLLTNKHMTCYNCEESTEESTKTISVTCASETPTKDCAKIGNGYARITFLG